MLVSRLMNVTFAFRMSPAAASPAAAAVAVMSWIVALNVTVAAPEVATWVIDRAIQAHGGAGVSQDHLLAELYAVARILQIADGPDEVHHMAIARRETRRYREQLVQAGATLAWEADDARGSAIVLRDPEGNEFCVS